MNWKKLGKIAGMIVGLWVVWIGASNANLWVMLVGVAMFAVFVEEHRKEREE